MKIKWTKLLWFIVLVVCITAVVFDIMKALQGNFGSWIDYLLAIISLVGTGVSAEELIYGDVMLYCKEKDLSQIKTGISKGSNNHYVAEITKDEQTKNESMHMHKGIKA